MGVSVEVVINEVKLKGGEAFFTSLNMKDRTLHIRFNNEKMSYPINQMQCISEEHYKEISAWQNQ